ncbi:MAG: epoxyqueuosine reductase QueH [Clostridiaceae bacterium]|nr:epoxyqueuosine reductase QueH [Clostridiaceae bacterium]HZW97317.1 epoxyqueuosine reductase QueH [Bacillota bacterium]
MNTHQVEKILLHTCCGPCAEYPVQELLAADYEPLLYYFNPNIQPQVEWQRRLESLQKLSEITDLALVAEGRSETERWLEMKDSQIDRCRYCYRTRLEKAAQYARSNGYPIFTTTLLVSPYQQHDLIVEIGRELAVEYGLEFLAADWRPRYRQGQQMARDDGLYRQRYCGCIISLEESSYKDKIKKELDQLTQSLQ